MSLKIFYKITYIKSMFHTICNHFFKFINSMFNYLNLDAKFQKFNISYKSHYLLVNCYFELIHYNFCSYFNMFCLEQI